MKKNIMLQIDKIRTKNTKRQNDSGPCHKISLIRSRLKKAYSFLESCSLCPHRCGVNRLKGDKGFCGVGFCPVVSSDNLHHGEEPPISGDRGSGTIFFTGCNLRCVFCQNYPISHLLHGNQITLPQLAFMMLRLQESGAHNINFVTPTHFAPQIMGALLIAYQKGLDIPLVYNCGGYESLEMLNLWDGIIDIYMPDMKYSATEMAKRYSSASDYPKFNLAGVKEMFRQVGNLELDENGIAKKGLLIRHLVLPEDISGTHEIIEWIANEISSDSFISLMSQYFPANKALSLPPLDRRISKKEYKEAKDLLQSLGFNRGWVQNEVQ